MKLSKHKVQEVALVLRLMADTYQELAAPGRLESRNWLAHILDDSGCCPVVGRAILGTEDILPAPQALMNYLHQRWPHFSGSRCYPVPDPTAAPDCTAEAAHKAYWEKPRWSGVIGFLRRDLAAFMQNELRALALYVEETGTIPEPFEGGFAWSLEDER